MDNEELPKGAWMFGLAAVIVLLVIVGLITSIRTVGTGQIGVVTRFGQVTGRELGEGIHLVAPFWTETVKRYDIRVQKEEVDVQAATSDQQDITAKIAVNYQPVRGDVLTIHREIGPEFRTVVLQPIMQEVFKGASAKYTATEAITNRAAVKADAYNVLKERMKKYNISVIDLSIVNFTFSPAYNQAIEAKQVAQQQAEKAKQDLERIKVEAEQRIAEANGKAEANRIEQSTITGQILQQKAIEKWDGKMPYSTGGDGLIFNIPQR